jgi:hypothetical protein
MRLIHCTAKLIKELGTPSLENPNTSPNLEGFGNWYANILRTDRKKCLLFTNEKTLYSFLIPNVLKKNIRNIVDEFLINLNLNLQAEGFSLEIINRVMHEYTEIGFAKTASKHVLGAMTQLMFEYEVLIEMKEGLENVNVLEMNKDINRSLMRGSRHLHPIEMLQELLTGVEVPRPRMRE